MKKAICLLVIMLMLISTASCNRPKAIGETSGEFIFSYNEYEEYFEKNLVKPQITYDMIDSVGDFYQFVAFDEGKQGIIYILTDNNGVTFMMYTASLQVLYWLDPTDEMPTRDFEPWDKDTDMRSFGDVVIDRENRSIAYEYDNYELASIEFIIDDYFFRIWSGSLDENHTGPKLYQYPTDGEETFISRLLDSTTAKEAVDELAEKILAEQE